MPTTLKVFYFLFISILFFGCAKKENSTSSKENSTSSSNEETTTSLGDNLTKGFMLDELNAFGATVLCNGKSAKEFIPRVGETVNCLFKDLTLATFTNVQKKSPDQGLQGSLVEAPLDAGWLEIVIRIVRYSYQYHQCLSQQNQRNVLMVHKNENIDIMELISIR